MPQYHCCHFKYLKNARKRIARKLVNYSFVGTKEMTKIQYFSKNDELISECIVMEDHSAKMYQEG